MGDVLGYDRFAAAGGDMGALTSAALGHKYADRMIGVHLFGAVPLHVFSRPSPLPPAPDFGFVRPAKAIDDPVLGAPPRPRRMASSHLFTHGLEPQTLAAAMHDSPAGMLAWLLHRRYWWSQTERDVLDAYDRDFLLTTFSLYWLTDCFASSVRTYREMIFRPWQPAHGRTPVVEAPTAITFFDHDELTGQSRFWVRDHVNLLRASSVSRGGHFAPAENPGAVVEELRATFRILKKYS
jgi:pimeloyl-ACP methyl ester carboxylesterase